MDSAKFQEDVYELLQNMKSDDDMIDGILSCVCDLLGSAVVTTSDSGAVSGGTFVGTGTGTISAEPDVGRAILKTACVAMSTMQSGGDAIFADALGNSINAVISSATVDCSVSGIITPPPPATPFPAIGKSSGVISCSPSDLIKALNATFATMGQMGIVEGFDGNLLFATNLTVNLVLMIGQGSVSTNGQANLLGSVGNGTAT